MSRRFPRRRAGLPAFCQILCFLALFRTAPAGAAAPPATIDLDRAIDTALRSRPELAAFSSDLHAADGRVLQASLRPNPELEFEVSNLADETSVGVSQVFETGGKREARTRRARAEIPVLRSDLERLRLDVAAEVRRAFAELLGAQERLKLKREAHDLANRLAETVAERVKAGAVSPIEETRARVALAAATADAARTLRELKEARLALAAAMGDPEPTFAEAAGHLSSDLRLPEWDALAGRLSSNPDLARWPRERALRESALETERALAVQDVSLKGSFTHNRKDEESLVTVGLSIPLPVFHRNQGSIREAEAGVAKAAHENRTAEVDVRSRLARSYEALAAAANEATILRDEALAGAGQAYEAVDEGYRLGKFRYLDVLDAGNALIETRLQYLDALVAVELARVDLSRLTGEPLPGGGVPEN